jgi:hypothetical protein
VLDRGGGTGKEKSERSSAFGPVPVGARGVGAVVRRGWPRLQGGSCTVLRLIIYAQRNVRVCADKVKSVGRAELRGRLSACKCEL